MKEQMVAGMLTLFLALGFILSIEVLAQRNLPVGPDKVMDQGKKSVILGKR